MINLTFSDTGEGIADVDILFQKVEGKSSIDNNNEYIADLGLLLSKELTILNKGVFSVESTIGVGSKFTISLPIIEKG